MAEDLTFEKVWAALMENREQMKETDRKMQETDRQLKEVAERMKETDLQMKETDRKIKETNRQIGRLGNRFGELAEHLVAPNISEKFKIFGFELKPIGNNIVIPDNTGRAVAEIDLLFADKDIVVAVEVKARPETIDIDDHVTRMQALRTHWGVLYSTQKFRGAIAGAIMPDNVRKYAHKAGFYVIEQSGDSVRITIPEGFTPREW